MIKLTADSTCDLSKELLEKYNISISPLHIVVDNETFDDGKNITSNDIFRLVGEENRNISTSAVNTYEYETFFNEFASTHDAIIHFNLGAHFSSTHQNAKIAASNFNNVYVIDSENLTTGTGYLVIEAAQLAAQGKTVEEIMNHIQLLIPKLDVSFIIPTMDYLLKGGRCNALEAFGATLLKIKPSIKVVDGKMTVGQKYRGALEKVIEKFIADLMTDVSSIDTKTLFITSPDLPEETIQLIKDHLNEYAIFENIYFTNAGCTISTHCGPGTVGIILKRK